MQLNFRFFEVCLFVLYHLDLAFCDPRVLYAVNAGGSSFVDSNGINFIADPISVGTESDYGIRLPIRRASPDDQFLYQTERWHDQSFHYTIPIREDGDFVLVLKFAEVYFYGSSQKVFDVILNDHHRVVKDLDIFDKVGHSVAHDEIIPLSVRKGKLSVNGEFSSISNQLKVEFAKGAADNPKICAFFLMRGEMEDAYRLPALTNQNTPPDNNAARRHNNNNEDEEEEETFDDEEEEEVVEHQQQTKASTSRLNKKPVKSGKPAPNPYQDDHTSLILPIVISLTIFIPTLLFMCKL